MRTSLAHPLEPIITGRLKRVMRGADITSALVDLAPCTTPPTTPQSRQASNGMSSLVAKNLASLREKKSQLRSEISALAILGAQVITVSINVGKDRNGKEILKSRTQPRGLNAEERTHLLEMRREIDNIDATFRALGQ